MLIRTGRITCEDLYEERVGFRIITGAYRPDSRGGKTFFIAFDLSGNFNEIIQTDLIDINVQTDPQSDAYFVTRNSQILILARAQVIRNTGNVVITRGGYAIKYCQCPDAGFLIKCQDSPNGYCCIQKKLVEDACRKLKR
jgi:hypothetical protein